MDNFKNTEAFKAEAEELLNEIEEAILDIEENPENMDSINKLFRIVHTIKGSSDMFGYNDIADFTHYLETVLERVRESEIKIDSNLADIVLSCRDHVKTLLYASEDGGASIDPEKEVELITRLQELLSTGKNEKKSIAEDIPEEATATATTESRLHTFHISFTPDPSIFLSGGDPADILDDLRELGECDIAAKHDKVPKIEELNPEECFLSWDITLKTHKDINDVKDVFIFINDENVSIKEMSAPSEDAPISEEAEIEDAETEDAQESEKSESTTSIIDDEDLLKEFIAESKEHLETIEDDFLELEETQDNPESELIGKIFRAIHTIKGASGFLGLDHISKLSHAMETLLSMIRSGEIKPETKYIEALLKGVDLLNIMLNDIKKSNSINIKTNLAILEKLIRDVSSEADEAFDNKINVEDEFEIDELTFNSLHKKGEYLYAINYELQSFEKENKMTPHELINELVSLGNILESKMKIPDTLLSDPISKMELKVDILYSTIVDPSLISIAVKLPEHNIREIKSSDISKNKTKNAKENKTANNEPVANAEKNTAASSGPKTPSDKKISDSNVRVPSERLDSLINIVGEMVITQAKLIEAAQDIENSKLSASVEEMERLIAELRDDVLTIRMMPIGSTFSRFKRLVRDLSGDLGKKISLVTEGAETELDKTVLDRLGDPLVHLIRNSIDHGIESPDDREKAGKTPGGTITLSAAHMGAHVVITIKDDGKGLDADILKAKAIEKGLIQKDAELSEHEIFSLIFAPGFSTAQKVSSVSGRGVGMDVVKRQIENLRGTVEIFSKKGEGTTIALSLPLTLAIIDGLLVKMGADKYIIPLSTVTETVELTAKERAEKNRRNIIVVRDKQIPYIRLRELFQNDGEEQNIENVVIVEFEEKQMGIVVDKVIGSHQTVIKSLGKLYKDVETVSGATIMGDGQVALILDIAGLLRYKERKDAHE